MAWKGITRPCGGERKSRHRGVRKVTGWAAEDAIRIRADKLGLVYDPSHWSLYIFEAPAIHAVKIGRSNCVAHRLQNIAASHPHDIFVYGALAGPAAEIKRLESEVHRRHRNGPMHMKGEWYRLMPDEAVKLVAAIASEIKAEVHESAQFPIGDLTEREGPFMVNGSRYTDCVQNPRTRAYGPGRRSTLL